MFELAGKKALVTGGSRGIGRGIALALAKQGSDVAINFHSNLEEANAVAEQIKSLGRQVLILQADVSISAEVINMFDQINKAWGQLDILINNAGIISYNDFTEISEVQWDQTINTNLKGQFLCAQQAAKMMMKHNWGRIINIASISSGGVGVSFPKLTHYTASKGGVIGMTENMALELGKNGINVNAIAPGVIETDMTKGSTPEQIQAIISRLPKGRMGKPEDIGGAAVFLASEEADYITGTVLYVDGGSLTG